MSYKVLVSKTFQQKFNKVQQNTRKKIKASLKELQKDPYMSRPNCDVQPLKDTNPKKQRVRVGEYRIIFFVSDKEIKVIDLLKREKGYARLD